MVSACLFSHSRTAHRALNAAWPSMATNGYEQDCGAEHVTSHEANIKLMFIITIT